MTATYRTSAAGGGTTLTADRTTSITALCGDLLIVICNASTNTNAAPTCTDDCADGRGTYSLIGTAAWQTGVNMGSVFVRQAPVVPTASGGDVVTVTVATGSNDAAEIVIVAYKGMSKFGTSAIRSSGFQANQASGGTPTPVLNQNALTGNPTICGVFSSDTTTSPNASWTERQDVSQATPTTALEVATRDSGFTSTSIAFAATQSSDFGSFAIELDSTFTEAAFLGTYPTTATAMHNAAGGTWVGGYPCNDASGNLAAQFGSAALVATSLTYSQAGAILASSAVKGTSALTSSSTVYRANTDDVVFAVLLNLSATGAGGTSLQLGQAGCFVIDTSIGVSGADFVLTAVDVGSAHTTTLYLKNVPTTGWILIMALAERSAAKTRFALITGGTTWIGAEGSLASFGALTSASGWGFGNGASTDVIDHLWVGNGAGAATGLSAGLKTAIEGVATALNVAAAATTSNLLLLGVG
jgi:hypothetical protein